MRRLAPPTVRAAALTAFAITLAVQLTFTAALRLVVVPLFVPASHVHHGLQRAGDSLFFHALAVESANGLRAGGFGTLGDERFPGLLHTKVLGILYYLAGVDSPYVVFVVNAAIAGASASLLVLLAALAGCRPPLALLAAAPVALSPLVLFSHSELLREPFAVFFGSLWAIGVLAAGTPGVGLATRRLAGVAALTAGFAGIAAIRPYLVLPLLLAMTVVVAIVGTLWLVERRRRQELRTSLVALVAGMVVAYVLVVLPGWADAFQYDDRSVSSAVAESVRAAGAGRAEALRRKVEDATGPLVLERDDLLVPSVCTVPWRRTAVLPTALDSKFEAIACSRQDFLRYCDQSALGARADRHCDGVIPTSALQLLGHLPRAALWGLATPFPRMWLDGFGSGGTGLRRAGYVVDGLVAYAVLPGLVLLLLRLRHDPVPAGLALGLVGVTTIYAAAVPSQFILARMRLSMFAPLLVLGVVGWVRRASRAPQLTAPGGTARTAQQELADFDPAALADRHDRQLSLLDATTELGPPPYHVLDLGGGSGVTAVWAARKGWPVTVVDVDPANLEVLRELLRGGEAGLPITTVVGDVCADLDLPEGAFDIAYLKDLVEHVPDYDRALRQALQALKPGGLVYVATTNVWCPLQQEYHGVGPYSWYPAWLKRRIREHAMARAPWIVHHTPYPALHWFSRGTLAEALRRAGFSRVWDVYDLVRAPQDLTRRTRLVYPLIRLAGVARVFRPLVDVAVPGLTLVAMKPRLARRDVT